MLSNYNQEVIFLGCCFPIKLFKSIFNPFLSAIFVAFSQKSHLNWILVCFYLIMLYGCPHARLCRLTCPRTLWGWVPELIAVVSELLSELFMIFSEPNTSFSEFSLLPSWMGSVTKNIKWLSVISKNISDTYYI